MMASAAILLAAALVVAGGAWAEPTYRALPGGALRTVLPDDTTGADVTVAPFQLRERPVSNADFRAFVARSPDWARGQAPSLFVGPSYLAGLTDGADDAPVTHVSWHAAAAYCASESARLPRWHEWEFAAAADATRADARDDPAWLATILAWYSAPGSKVPGAIGQGVPNVYGIHDLHGLQWDWVEDFNGLFVDADSRAGQGKRQLAFCGAGAVSLADRRNYAILMRVALLAALDSNHDGARLGFRCAR
jgi:formylglycine-generating enzyme required for sulfatase activity